MPTLEIRRHAQRKPGGGSQLSQQGVELARRLGDTLGPFNHVATSVVPRARETAIAMGYAVDHELVTLSTDEEVYSEIEESRWWTADQPMASLASLVQRREAVWRYGSSIAALWRDLLTPLGDGGSVLFIGHSGELEIALLCCFPGADYSSFRAGFGPLEGAKLHFDGEPARFTKFELLRLTN